jgi:hypothetical protein
MAYLSSTRFKALTLIPSEWIDAIETASPGWVDAQLEYLSAWLDTRLRKRYGVPFVAPYPVAVEGWITRIMTLRCLLRRGIDPTDQAFAQLQKDHDTAEAEIREAADSEKGLFDLPLSAAVSTSGVTQSTPSVYSEQSPYTGYDVQRAVGRQEDQIRRGW